MIGLTFEGLSNGRRFGELAAQAADAGKPVVALKIGCSAVGAEASLAHSEPARRQRARL